MPKNIDVTSSIISERIEERKEIDREIRVANAEVIQESYNDNIVRGMTIPFAQLSRKVSIKARNKFRRTDIQKAKKSDTDHEVMLQDSDDTGLIRDAASRYNDQNPEFEEQILMAIANHVKQYDDAKTILEKIQYFYQDWSLTDGVVDFLLEVFDGPVKETLKELKLEINDKYKREIIAGKNIAKEANLFADKGIGSSVFLRKMYLDITGNPREAPELFNELSSKFPYEQLKVVLNFFLKSLGSDLRAKGSSIDKGELWRLMTETRVMQSILGVYRFFKGRMRLMLSMFAHYGLVKPAEFTFESISKLFMQLISERFPSADKFRSILTRLGFGKNTIGMLIVATQLRDAVREVDTQRIFGREGMETSAISMHMYELWEAIILFLEELEDEYDEEKEKEEENDDETPNHKKNSDKDEYYDEGY